MPGGFSRQKGKRGERAVVNLLRSWGWFAQRTAPMQAGKQVEGYPDVKGWCLLRKEIYGDNNLQQERKLYWNAECKLRERMPPLDDVLTLGKKHGTNVVFHKRNHKPMLVTMEADFFMVMMSNFVQAVKFELEKEDENGESQDESGGKVA